MVYVPALSGLIALVLTVIRLFAEPSYGSVALIPLINVVCDGIPLPTLNVPTDEFAIWKTAMSGKITNLR